MSFLSDLFSKKKNRVVVIGLDGTPYSLIKKYINDGILPNFKKIISKGSLNQMDSSIPEISSVAWSSFMTGSNPAQHGIFGFIDLQPNSYNLRFPNFSNLKMPTVWDTLSQYKKRASVINLPSTYPVREMNGVLIAGFVAPNINKSVYPPSLISMLQETGYIIDVDSSKARHNPDEFISDLFKSLNIRIKTFFHFWKKENWELFIGVITETDRLHHFLWSAYEDEAHKYHNTFIDYYKKIDAFLGEVFSLINNNDTLFILSDHGFTRIKKQVNLNFWLRENGYLHFEKIPPDSLNNITSETKAFVLEPSRIYINLKDKFPKGSVTKEEYENVRNELMGAFLKIKDEENGNLIIKNAFKKEDIYSGNDINTAPDIVLVSHYGYDLKASIKSNAFSEIAHFTGMHTQDDAFIAANYSMNFSKKPSVADIQSYIFERLGIAGK